MTVRPIKKLEKSFVVQLALSLQFNLSVSKLLIDTNFRVLQTLFLVLLITFTLLEVLVESIILLEIEHIERICGFSEGIRKFPWFYYRTGLHLWHELLKLITDFVLKLLKHINTKLAIQA